MESYKTFFAGLSLEFEESDKLNYLATTSPIWLEYISRLVTHSYGPNLDTKQAILDALSPFQIASKLWVAALVSRLTKDVAIDTYTVIGSWFGQLPVLLAAKFDVPLNYAQAHKVLIDKDPIAQHIAGECARHYLRKTIFLKADIFQIVPPTTDNQMILWTGVEHFAKNQVKMTIDYMSKKKSIFILQGTDREDYDHVNRVTSLSALEQYFHRGHVLYRGQMKTPLGTRYMVAYTT